MSDSICHFVPHPEKRSRLSQQALSQQALSPNVLKPGQEGFRPKNRAPPPPPHAGPRPASMTPPLGRATPPLGSTTPPQGAHHLSKQESKQLGLGDSKGSEVIYQRPQKTSRQNTKSPETRPKHDDKTKYAAVGVTKEQKIYSKVHVQKGKEAEKQAGKDEKVVYAKPVRVEKQAGVRGKISAYSKQHSLQDDKQENGEDQGDVFGKQHSLNEGKREGSPWNVNLKPKRHAPPPPPGTVVKKSTSTSPEMQEIGEQSDTSPEIRSPEVFDVCEVASNADFPSSFSLLTVQNSST